MKSSKEETNAFLIHISALLGFLFPFGGIIIPLVLWKAQKTESPFLNNNGKEAVNFNITYGFYKVILAVGLFTSFFVFAFLNVPGIIFLLFGIYGLFELMSVCLIIIAASKAQKGETYQYPMTINFLK
ncbi:DUF4870 domain-containing protein [Flavicella sp.]|uniref:DUF4870 domain-containing protein n=1 Tax=Flavicella sp. TaxID=2957742 RepID=UPI002626C6D0|nr:DUF4870 domain-containing protein [Flavicella sp.]MDG1806043.1 DUF4870 domain-containing protein [Flavicella sp.]MDG2280730.1 DUF4870 domain-containing protein [Flavicella sp.]